MAEEREGGRPTAAIDLAQVSHLSHLARLGLDEAELGALRDQLEAIVQAVDRLQEADLGEVDPTAQVGGLYDVFRDDELTPCLTPEEALANAPGQEAALLRVPAIQ